MTVHSLDSEQPQFPRRQRLRLGGRPRSTDRDAQSVVSERHDIFISVGGIRIGHILVQQMLAKPQSHQTFGTDYGSWRTR